MKQYLVPPVHENVWRRIGRLVDNGLEAAWYRLPESIRSSRYTRPVAELAYSHTCRVQRRMPDALYTRFLRNRPQLETISDIAMRHQQPRPLRLAVLGCSKGAELYSILHVLNRRCPELEVSAVGLDISEDAVAQAASGTYGLHGREVAGLSDAEVEALFLREKDRLRIHERLRRGVRWVTGDACAPSLMAIIGPQDIVIANNFLVHLSDELAEQCFRNIADLVTLGGYVCTWGMNLDLRTRLARELGLVPILSRIEEIHNADERAREVWPWRYWGLEPLDRDRPDWRLRYATIFQAPFSSAK
ncbi:CheR family methyltransferase [Petrachloros mirabilis]